MPKPVVSFKPTEECGVQLAELMVRWGCDRTAAIVKSIAISYGGGKSSSTREVKAATTKVVGRGSVKRSQSIPKPDWKE